MREMISQGPSLVSDSRDIFTSTFGCAFCRQKAQLKLPNNKITGQLLDFGHLGSQVAIAVEITEPIHPYQQRVMFLNSIDIRKLLDAPS